MPPKERYDSQMVMDDCKTCENYPCHVSRCVFTKVYCMYFPYDMPNKERIDLKVEKTEDN